MDSTGAEVVFQRIEAAVAQFGDGVTVVRDLDAPPSLIRFRVKTRFGGIPVIESSGHLRTSELEHASDNDLRDLLVALAGGRL